MQTQYLYDSEEGGTLEWRSELDARRYFQVTQRSNFALRLFAGVIEGNVPGYFYIGGSPLLVVETGVPNDAPAEVAGFDVKEPRPDVPVDFDTVA